MAVVQISRIQHRRGKKNTGTGIPQLASGELGWAVDAQELYIGNGAVSEGAPSVGNTRVLTEKDDILELAGQYAYKRDSNFLTGVDSSSPVERTIQSKLDDIVDVRDFGATGDGSDQTEKLQRAIDQLFINSATKGIYSSRVELRIPAGEYKLTSPLYIPPFANIAGDGKGKTYFIAEGEHAFRTVNETSTPGSYADDSTTDALNQARQITLKNFTVLHTSYGGTMRLESCVDSLFENIEFLGQWNTGDGIANDYTAVKLNAQTAAVTSSSNTFLNCDFYGFVNAVFSDYDISYNRFVNGKIDVCAQGFVLGTDTDIGGTIPGKATGPMNNIIENYNFLNIDRQGIIIDHGRYNRSMNNTFIAVGNDGGNSSSATHSIIRFGDRSNTSVNDYFERTADLTVNPAFGFINYPPEVEGPKDYNNNFEVSTALGDIISEELVMLLPADQTKGIVQVNYRYFAPLSVTDDVVRDGQLTVVFDRSTTKISLNDEYTTIGDPTRAEGLEFTAYLVSDKIEIKAVNTTMDGGTGDEFIFTLRHIA